MQIKSEHLSFLGTKDASPAIYNPKKTLDFSTMSLNETYAHLNIAKKLRADTINCSLCSKNFKSFRGEATHRETFHVEKSEFKCKECDESFVRKDCLKVHIAAFHEKLTPYKCNLCVRSFAKKANLQNHIAALHEISTLHKCPDCKKSFRQKRHLQNHFKTHLPRPNVHWPYFWLPKSVTKLDYAYTQ